MTPKRPRGRPRRVSGQASLRRTPVMLTAAEKLLLVDMARYTERTQASIIRSGLLRIKYELDHEDPRWRERLPAEEEGYGHGV